MTSAKHPGLKNSPANGKIVILGAGITGLVLARELSAAYGDNVILIEKENFLGGMASTLSRDYLRFDLGSHRIHTDYNRKTFKYIRDELGVALLKRPRKGALYFKGRFLSYPPAVFNFLKEVSPKNILKFAISYFKRFNKPRGDKNNYQEVMIRNVGEEIYRVFYRDFARKLWGINPENMSATGMKRRITFLDPKALWRIISGKTKYFFYPKNGIGDIAEKAAGHIIKNKGIILKGTEVKKISMENNTVKRIRIENRSGEEEDMEVSVLVSTIPADSLFPMVFNGKITGTPLIWRGLRILYVHIDKKLEMDNETFYFPSLDVKIGRVSDISKYSGTINPSMEGTLLTVEMSLSPQDPEWNMAEDEFLKICLKDLEKTGILQQPFKILNYFSKWLDKAYPVHEMGWKEKFDTMRSELNKISNLFVIGRKGLFLHCNIDHCIIQALECAGFIRSCGIGDKRLWDKKSAVFFNFCARD